jgi:hypothetical protein
MGLASAGIEHRHRCFVGMQHLVGGEHFDFQK